MSDVSQWSTTPASNNSTPPDGFPENQAPSTVNDSAREVMAALAKWYADLDGTLTSGGSGGAYTLTTNQTHAALADQSMVVFKANHANQNGHTLNVDTLGAKTLVGPPIITDQIVVASYNATNDEYEMVGPVRTTFETAIATTSGTAHDFTGIRSDARRIIVMFEGVALSGSESILVQIGDSGGFETSGYLSSAFFISSGSAINTNESTAGFLMALESSSALVSGHMIITNIDGDTWVSSHNGKRGSSTVLWGGGDKTLSATLDRVRITRTGSDTFSAGKVNILVD